MQFLSLRYMKYIDLLNAYTDCKKHKRSSVSCALFETDEINNLMKLYKEINDDTYQIGTSNTFVVTSPKRREIFAANFNDRIVHHYIIQKLLPYFEAKFIDDTYNCRKGKGVLFGINRIQEKIRNMSNNYTSDCFILKLDLSAFFMSINKVILWKKLETFIKENYIGEDKDLILHLSKMVVMHCPQDNCKRCSPIEMWNSLPSNKSLFSLPKDKGLAIGNLTSQIFANFYMSFFDDWICSIKGIEYGRYVDDIILISSDKKLLLKLIPKIRIFLKENLELELNNKKLYLQHYSKGVAFIGYVIKKDNIYPGKRLRSNIYKFLKEYSDSEGYLYEVIPFISRYNSYMGFLKHTKSFQLRKYLWKSIPFNIRRRLKIRKNYLSVKRKNMQKVSELTSEYQEVKVIGNTYYLRLHPVVDGEFTVAYEIPLKKVPTEEDKKFYTKKIIEQYKVYLTTNAVSYGNSQVNKFIINGEETWFDKATRVGLNNSINWEISTGKTETTIYYNNKKITIPTSDALSMLGQIEMYAVQCFRNTEELKQQIEAISSIDELETFDVEQGYPEILTFTYGENSTTEGQK